MSHDDININAGYQVACLGIIVKHSLRHRMVPCTISSVVLILSVVDCACQPQAPADKGNRTLHNLSLICIGAHMNDVLGEPVLQQWWALPMLMQRLCHLCLLDPRYHTRKFPQPGAPF